MKILRFLLFPFAILYDAITSIRNFLFDKDVLKSTKFDAPVIAVGNLSVGGTGKTPQIEYLINLLQSDYKIAVLSRGYKRKTKGFILINDSHSAEDVGDEPLQFFTKFKNIQVAVDANRTNGITQLLNQKDKPDVILLDDAYQHRKVTASFYVLLTKYNDLYANDFILPTGNLRESRRGAKRANLIVVTKCPKDISEAEKRSITKRLNPIKKQQVFFSSITYNECVKGEKEIAVTQLSDYEIVLVTGIANPKPMLTFLEEQQITFHHNNFPDHHDFSSNDISQIQSKLDAISSKEKMILTTEKDYMRLKGKVSDLYYLPIQTQIINTEEAFNQQILKAIKKPIF